MKAKHPGIYVCTLEPYVGYIGISDNVANRWFDAQSNHNENPEGKWKPRSLTGFSKDSQPFKRKVSGRDRSMNLYAACGTKSVSGKTKRGRKIVCLNEEVLRMGIESLMIYKQSQVNSKIDTNRVLKWGSNSRTILQRNSMFLNKSCVFTGNQRSDQGEIKPREWMKRNFGSSKIELEGLPRGRINEMKINNVGTAVEAYHNGNPIP